MIRRNETINGIYVLNLQDITFLKFNVIRKKCLVPTFDTVFQNS